MATPRHSEQQERLQRVRIGATGLAAVFLVVMSAGALTNSASEESPVEDQANVETPGDLPDLVGNNVTEEPQEPLAELGVAPSTGNDAAGGKAP